jgi:hypothetical protein
MSRRERAKIMKLRRWILKWLSTTEDDSAKYGMIKETIHSAPRNVPSREGLSFTLYPAVGGHVLECRNYDQKTDRNNSTLHMIHEDQNFADQVAKAIMLEMMKQ